MVRYLRPSATINKWTTFPIGCVTDDPLALWVLRQSSTQCFHFPLLGFDERFIFSSTFLLDLGVTECSHYVDVRLRRGAMAHC